MERETWKWRRRLLAWVEDKMRECNKLLTSIMYRRHVVMVLRSNERVHKSVEFIGCYYQGSQVEGMILPTLFGTRQSLRKSLFFLGSFV